MTTNDELLQALYDNWKTNKNRTRVSFKGYQEIRALIEHRPKVTMKDLENWIVVLNQFSDKEKAKALSGLLIVRGITVEEEK